MYESIFIPFFILALVGLLGLVVGLGLSDTRKKPE